MGGACARWLSSAIVIVCVFAGCLTRPITGNEPTTKESFTGILPQGAVDKVDLLFMIDNSQSMGDKEELLGKAVPKLIDRLLNPHCVLETDGKTIVPPDTSGACPDGAKHEFNPIIDMHIGIVSSSLGSGGSPNSDDVCNAGGFNDDHAHLLNRKNDAMASPLSDAAPSNYLAWMPDVPKNAKHPLPTVPRIGDEKVLVDDFRALVTGVQEKGCGLEAQMESWYRFLVQPDPWDSIIPDRSQSNLPAARLTGVDATILQQRHDFLRPDSLLAVIVVTDEDDSWTDPMWQGGHGWVTRARDNGFCDGVDAQGRCIASGGRLPRATSACAIDPNSPDCTWCGYQNVSDPNCSRIYNQGEDNLNVRYTDDMKRRYGMNPQFPIQRYIDGLTSLLVSDRNGERLGRHNCRNPIYAATLPTDPNANLCGLPAGTRTSDLVFFALIGGVPWQLLATNPGDPTQAFKSALTEDDWTRIIGRDPSRFDLSGIDPHMIEAIEPRTNISYPTNGTISCGPSASQDCDKINSREWDTHTSKIGLDLQYACTFKLTTKKDCSVPDTIGCDCGPSGGGALPTSPLCDPTNLNIQTRGKAYPTIRELRVVKAMGNNGVVASICPPPIDDETADNYGYNPAVRAIVDRLKNALNGECLPQPLTRGPDGKVACLVLTILQGPSSDQPTACNPALGLRQPDPAVLKDFNAKRLAAAEGAAAASGMPVADLSPVCEIVQMVPDTLSPVTYGGKPTCDGNGNPGWCYVEGMAAGTCSGGSAQAIRFGVAAPGETIIQCIQQTN